MKAGLVSVIIPAKDEPSIPLSHAAGWDLVVVVDSATDTTPLPRYEQRGSGPADAIRTGIRECRGDVIVTMCADGSDDPAALDALAAAVRGGAAVAVADRYMPDGGRIGGPRVKGWLSRLANKPLHLDATNLYKAYDAAWLRGQIIESRHGFTIGMELTAKARREGCRIERVPVIWRDRTAGRSHWRWSWLPSYLSWWAYSMTSPQ